MIRTLAWWGMNQRMSLIWQLGLGQDGEGRVGQDPDGPLEDGPAVHGQVVQPLVERPRPWAGSGCRRPGGSAGRPPSRRSRADRRPAPARALPGPSRTAPAPSPKRGKLFWSPGLITRLLQSPPMTRARSARPRRDELRGGDQGEDEPRAGRLDVERRAVQLEPVLDQVRRRGEAHVGRERADDQEVDLATGRSPPPSGSGSPPGCRGRSSPGAAGRTAARGSPSG